MKIKAETQMFTGTDIDKKRGYLRRLDKLL